MGRGERGEVASSLSRSEGVEEGEIAFLDADNIDDYQSRAAGSDNQASFGAPDDDRAIRNLIAILKRRPGARASSDEQLEDQAISLYNGICAKISDGTASDAEIKRASELFDENPSDLIDRLRQ